MSFCVPYSDVEELMFEQLVKGGKGVKPTQFIFTSTPCPSHQKKRYEE